MALKIISVYSPEFKGKVLFPIMEEGKVTKTVILPREEAEKMIKEIDESKKEITDTGDSDSTKGIMIVVLVVLILGAGFYFLKR